jgi:hypothetical protein
MAYNGMTYSYFNGVKYVIKSIEDQNELTRRATEMFERLYEDSFVTDY